MNRQILTDSTATTSIRYFYVTTTGKQKFHHTDGPAITSNDGKSMWYLDGKLHRIDGPAIEYASGHRQWYQYGKRHREDGPAMEWPSGSYEWYLRGLRHRLDGPAIQRMLKIEINLPGRYWYVGGRYCTDADKYKQAVARWLSYKEVTRDEISQLIGKFKIVEW